MSKSEDNPDMRVLKTSIRALAYCPEVQAKATPKDGQCVFSVPCYEQLYSLRQGVDISSRTKKTSNRLTVIKAIIKTSHLSAHSGCQQGV